MNVHLHVQDSQRDKDITGTNERHAGDFQFKQHDW